MNAVLRPPESAGLGRGFAFALVAHGLLFVALSAGVSWRSQPTEALEAELWSAVPQAAAPREEAPPPPPPAPEPKVDPQKALREAEAAEQEAEIALAREKARKERERREQREAEEKKRKAAEAQAQAEKDKREKQEKLEKDKAAKESKEADARREAQRQENLRRIQGMAGASGSATATGTAAQSSGPSASYAGRVKAQIRPHIIYSDEGGPNPQTEVQVILAPDGRINSVRTLKPSSDPDWDKAVLRAIEKAERLPRDTDGRVHSPMVITFRPRE